jgi:hypothetical protein
MSHSQILHRMPIQCSVSTADGLARSTFATGSGSGPRMQLMHVQQSMRWSCTPWRGQDVCANRPIMMVARRNCFPWDQSPLSAERCSDRKRKRNDEGRLRGGIKGWRQRNRRRDGGFVCTDQIMDVRNEGRVDEGREMKTRGGKGGRGGWRSGD